MINQKQIIRPPEQLKSKLVNKTPIFTHKELKNSLIIFGWNVKKYRSLNNIDQEKLSKLSNLSISTVRNIENGRNDGYVSGYIAISKVLNKTLDEMFFS